MSRPVAPAGSAASEAPRASSPWLELVFATAVFWLCYTQLPLYSSTQNTYFLHGLARAGVGFLSSDWLARTADPVPVFTRIVEWTVRGPGPWAIPLYSLVLFGLYLASLVTIAGVVAGRTWSRAERLAYLAALTVLHSAALGFASLRLSGSNLPRLFERGLAEQYLLGPVFQPSSFGVLLLASLASAARGRFVAAAAWAGLATVFHPTYLLAAALLQAVYLIRLVRRPDARRSLAAASAVALGTMGSVAGYVALAFRATTPAIAEEARRILVEVRLPHHADPHAWLGPAAAFQIGLVALALVLVRRSPLFPLLLWPALAGAALTVAQLLSGSRSLALLFPWRISVVLVPVATASLLALGLDALARRLAAAGPAARRVLAPALAVVWALLLVVGAASTRTRWRAPAGPEPDAVLAAARARAGARDLYVVPPAWERFRVAAAVPVVADFKNHPLRDRDVVEWYARVRLVQGFYGATGDSACVALERLRSRYPVTRLVDRADHLDAGRCGGLPEVYRDDQWVIYDVSSAPGGPS